MSPLGSIGSLTGSPLQRIDSPLPKIGVGPAMPNTAIPKEGFGSMLDGLVSAVADKQGASQAEARKVLLGDSDQLHQSVIAMQEASVAFTMMVEVRNKLVESYQELMRMQV